MKIFFVFISFVLVASFAKAENIFCSSDPTVSDLASTHSYGSGITDSIVFKCIPTPRRGSGPVIWGNASDVRITGKGLSLYFTGADAVRLSCPNRSLKDLKGKKLYGVKVSASVIAGPNVGMFYNNTDACILYGVQVGVGASLVGATLQF